MVDLKKLEEAARLIIEAVGDDPTREGLVETPKRFADMMAEQFAYNAVSNEDIAREFEKTFETPESDMVVVKDIDIFSHCEHHIALMYNMKVAVGYIPRGRVIGLSKIARIADALHDGYLSQQRTAHLGCQVLAAILAKYIVLVLRQFGRRKPRHVLYQS